MGRQETVDKTRVESGGNDRRRVISREAVNEFGGSWRKSVERR